MRHDHERTLRGMQRALLAGFLLVTLALLVWAIGRAPTLMAREDNPRLVEAELRIRRGRILDRHGIPLAETIVEGERPLRRYTINESGPAVGYYSFRHGTAGIEDSYNSVLRGDSSDPLQTIWRRWLHQSQQGRDVQLTLDATLQVAAESFMGAETGAIVLLATPLGASNQAELLSLVSHPGYDPNLLDEQFDALIADETAPLLNRTAQGQYQPGLAVQPFLLAAALDQGQIVLDEPAQQANRPVQVRDQTKQCASPPPDPATWIDVLHHRCPFPMTTLGGSFTSDTLGTVFADFGWTEPVSLPLNMEIPAAPALENRALAAIGQDTLTVTPLQMAAAWTALMQNGRLPSLQLVTAVQSETDPTAWLPVAVDDPTPRAVSAATAAAMQAALPALNGRTEFSVLALAGPEGSNNGWYLGSARTASTLYTIVVIVENADSVKTAESIGRGLLAAATQ